MSDNEEVNKNIPEEVIELFGGEYDLERMDEKYSEKLTLIPAQHSDLVKLLMIMIRNGELMIMDKESCVPMDASGVIGYKNNKIIIFCER